MKSTHLRFVAPSLVAAEGLGGIVRHSRRRHGGSDLSRVDMNVVHFKLPKNRLEHCRNFGTGWREDVGGEGRAGRVGCGSRYV